MTNVASVLLVQVLSRLLCVLGGFSALDWREFGVFLGAEAMKWAFVEAKILCILLGIACWWRWRALLRGMKVVPDRCSACLYPAERDRCPECGVVESKESRISSLADLHRLQANDFAEVWIFLAFLILIRIVGAGMFVGVSVVAGTNDAAALRRLDAIASGTSNWFWFEAPFVAVSFVLAALGIRTLWRHRGSRARR